MNIRCDRLYSTGEAATVLDVSPDRVRQLARAGSVSFIQTPLGRLFDADAVDAMAHARSSQPRPMGRRGEER